MSNQWFRMYAEFASDHKVQMLPEAMQRRLVMLMCLRCNGDVTLHDSEVTFQLRISDEQWAETKAVFIERGFIDGANKLLNWDKRQYRSDSSAERVARYRERKKKDVTTCNVTVTPPDTEQIQNRTDKENPPKGGQKKSPKGFDEFWTTYPASRRKEKPKALAEWEKAAREHPPDEIIAGLRAYLLTRECQEGFAPYPAKWLKNERWSEDHEADRKLPEPGKTAERGRGSDGKPQHHSGGGSPKVGGKSWSQQAREIAERRFGNPDATGEGEIAGGTGPALHPPKEVRQDSG